MSSHAEKWEKEGIRVKKIKLKPTVLQKRILEKWTGCVRYVYNKCLKEFKLNPELLKNKNLATKKFITQKDNNIIKNGDKIPDDKYLYDWEIETPKDIRKGALRDLQKAYKTAFSNLRNKNITNFNLRPKLKKYGKEHSIEIPNTAIKCHKNSIEIYPNYKIGKIKTYKSYIKDLKSIKMYCRLKKENNNWYLLVPEKVKTNEIKQENKICAIDPGIRKMATIFSENEIVEIIPNKILHKYYNKIDKLKSLRAKNKIKSISFKKGISRNYNKINNLVNEIHYKTINYLKQFNTIFLPSFETQDMVKGKLHKHTKRDMLCLSFYKFQQRLLDKAKLLKNCNVKIVNEAYTSKTCGLCGHINPKNTKENLTCQNCNITYDRDINGARNIFIKNVLLK
jgi:transposase